MFYQLYTEDNGFKSMSYLNFSLFETDKTSAIYL